MYWNKERETMSRDEMRALQGAKLADCVKRVYENVPVYQKKFDEAGIQPGDIRSLDDITKLPFTDKYELAENYPYGFFAVPMRDIVRIQASSGTTGKQKVLGYTRNDLKLWGEVMARTLTAGGATADDIVHVSYGYGLFTGGLGAHAGAEEIGATVVPVSTGNTKRQIQILRDFGCTAICCTPSYALYIAETLAKMGLGPDDISLKYGFFGAEPWTENMRQEIERSLGIRAYDIFGLTEMIGPGVAFECDAHAGLHVNEDHFIPEIIDPETCEPLPDGTPGELVFSSVTKEGMPLLRYRTRDICTITHETCACGRTLARMSKPKGRTDDMLIVRGVNVFPSQIEAVLLDMDETFPYYMIFGDRVGALDTMEIELELRDGYPFDQVRRLQELSQRIKSAVESSLGIAANIRLVPVGTIERSEGKAKHVVDKRNLK